MKENRLNWIKYKNNKKRIKINEKIFYIIKKNSNYKLNKKVSELYNHSY